LPEQHPQCARQLVVNAFQDPGQCLFAPPPHPRQSW
jgi:hypothetical protein